MIKEFVTAVLLALFVFLPVSAWSSPFLICDPQKGVIAYDVEINGTIVASGVVAEGDGSIRYDLTGQIPGSYTFRLKATGEGDYPSDWSLPFDATKPENPGNVRISQ